MSTKMDSPPLSNLVFPDDVLPSLPGGVARLYQRLSGKSADLISFDGADSTPPNGASPLEIRL